MEQKKKAKPSDQLIKSLMNDLKDMGEPTGLTGAAAQESSPPAASGSPPVDSEKTVPVKVDLSQPFKPVADSQTGSKTSSATGSLSVTRGPIPVSAPVSVDAQLQQADNLRIAQARILELEKMVDKYRSDNDQLVTSMELAKSRLEEATTKVKSLEKNRVDAKEQSAAEIAMYRENSQVKDQEISRLKLKVQEMEGLLQSDMKKIRVRERELENRLELSKIEKNALVRSKDETILDLKRKIDQMTAELEMANEKTLELGRRIEANQEQFSRTVRALRLALTNLEVHENTSSITLAPLKKAE